MHIHLAYGREGLDIEVPDGNLSKVLTMPPVPPQEKPQEELRRQLGKPIGGKPLGEQASRATTACIAICDITRPVPNALILPPILETLERNGIKRDNITLLVATGLHRPSTQDELLAMAGGKIVGDYRILDHHARELQEQEYLGTTRRNTPVYIDRTYCSADLKITTGFIEPHLMAGFSGGRKLVAPGCAGELTIKALHSPLFLENPLCREGSIDGNPLHEELLEIAAMAGHDFIVNVTLDVSHATTGIFAGDPIQAHAAGVRHARHSVCASIAEPADVVVTTSAGYPLDLTLYQAVKGMTAALPAVKKGGRLILAAECAEGLGSHEFAAMARRFRTAEEFIESISANPVVIDQWQLEECAKAVRHAEVVLVSPKIHENYAGELFIRTAASVGEALQEGIQKFGPKTTVAVIPKGPYTLVEMGGSGE